jgi:hypothetical protein
LFTAFLLLKSFFVLFKPGSAPPLYLFIPVNQLKRRDKKDAAAVPHEAYCSKWVFW